MFKFDYSQNREQRNTAQILFIVSCLGLIINLTAYIAAFFGSVADIDFLLIWVFLIGVFLVRMRSGYIANDLVGTQGLSSFGGAAPKSFWLYVACLAAIGQALYHLLHWIFVNNPTDLIQMVSSYCVGVYLFISASLVKELGDR